MDKRQLMEEAIEHISTGCVLALGGLTLYRRPFAFVRSLIKRYQQTGEPGKLTLLALTSGMESDLLVGAGMVERVRTCYFGLEIFGLAPMFTYYANRGMVEVIEETEASLAFGLRAKMAGVGFMPAQVWVGTDLPRLRPDVKEIEDPYSGMKYMAFPAIQADVVVIHALRADWEGNALIGDHKGMDIELAQTARKVIITAEEIVPKLNKADLIAPLISAVVEAPQGALPTSCHPVYPLDGKAILSYAEQVGDPDAFLDYLHSIL